MLKKLIFCFILCFSAVACLDLNDLQKQEKTIKQQSVLLLKIEGLITGEISSAFMEDVRKYAGKDRIKGVLIRVNSPGGTVGASQEINSTVLEIQKFYKKPVYVSGGDLVASGAVYSIISADKIFVSPGTLFGSIGVLMQFHNVEELIRWAKVDIYNLKAGEFKDSGSPYRAMTLRERELFEQLMDDTLEQFKLSIAKGRKMESKEVEEFADGRIFSGADALEYGLVDSLGTFNQAIRAIGEKTGLSSNPHLFDPRAKTPYEKFFDAFSAKGFSVSRLFSLLNQVEKLSGQALYILPSYMAPY